MWVRHGLLMIIAVVLLLDWIYWALSGLPCRMCSYDVVL